MQSAATDLVAKLEIDDAKHDVRETHPTALSEKSLKSLLDQVEQSIGEATARMSELEAEASKQQIELAELRMQIDEQRTLTDAERRQMLDQLRATWRLYTVQQRHSSHYGQPPRQWRRTQRYLDTLQSHLNTRRAKTRLALIDVMASVDAANGVQRALNRNARQLAQERNTLKHLEAQREPIMIQLGAVTAQAGNRLKTRYAETKAVRLGHATRDNALAENGLLWPLTGTVRTRFGDESVPSQPSQGIQIDVPTGETAHAVGEGVVLFADWMRGKGLLVVIDHGDGMMAVYGNNKRLLVRVGDRVAAGDPIAHVGAFELAEDHAQLYFEIRIEGRAVDPLPWLAEKPS